MILTVENTCDDFKNNPPELAILPINVNGFTDALMLSDICRTIAGGLQQNCYVLPVWNYGTESKDGIPNLKSDTLSGVVSDLIVSLEEHDIYFTVLVNGLGSLGAPTALPEGNSIIKTVCRQLNLERSRQKTIWLQPLRVAKNALLEKDATLDDRNIRDSLLQNQNLFDILVQSSIHYICTAMQRLQ